MSQDRELNVAAFAGSLRRGSYNRALLRAALEVTPAGMRISILEIGDIPLYNGDVEAEGDPEPVARFKTAIRDATGSSSPPPSTTMECRESPRTPWTGPRALRATPP